MIKVNVTKSSQAPISSVFIRKTLKDFLSSQGIVSDAVVNVAVVTTAKMLKMGQEYLGEKDGRAHNVLSFNATETKSNFVYPPSIIYLGEIVICFNVAVEEAKKEGVKIDDKFEELLTHGALHLLGIHHK